MRRILVALVVSIALVLAAQPSTALACDPGDPGFPPGFSC